MSIDSLRSRIILAVIAHCMAGGKRRANMRKLALFFGIYTENWEGLLKSHLRKLKKRAASRLLPWLLSVIRQPDLPIPEKLAQ